MDIDKFFERIELKNPSRQPSFELLKDICMAIVSKIPFETLDLFGGKRKTLDLTTIYENIVIKKRGGYCYELNSLLHWALDLLGYNMELKEATHYNGHRKQYDEFCTHLLLLVSLENGEKYLTDVGWGGSSFVLPLLLKVGIEQSQPNGVYRLSETENMYVVEKKRQTYLKTDEQRIQFDNKLEEDAAKSDDPTFLDIPWNRVFGIYKASCTLADCEIGNNFTQDKHEYLRENAIVAIQNANGRKFFLRNLYFEKQYLDSNTISLVKFRRCSIDEMYDVLEKEFGIVLDFELNIKCL